MLPQLAVSAKILCLLMVVICGAVPSMVRSVRLYSSCSHRFVNIHHNGTVSALSGENDQPNLTISSRDFGLRLLIHSPIENMYLCFNPKWKLVGRLISRKEALSQELCLFKEEMMENGHNMYSSVKDEERYIGFNSRGQQIRRMRSQLSSQRRKCLSFMKDDSTFSISRHNQKLAGELPVPEVRRRRLRRPCPERMRHPHGRRPRRWHCAPT